MTIRQYLKDSVLIMDGAMGTYYDLLYHGEDTIAEEANLSHPERIRKIHEDYIRAGARLIRTNTFELHEEAVVSLQRNGLSEKEYIEKSLKQAVFLAREAAKITTDEVYIGADIGPLSQKDDERENWEEYKHLIDLFLEEGLNIFVLETFPRVAPVKEMAAYIKEKNPDSFVIGQFAVNPTGFSQMGDSVRRIFGEAGEVDDLDCCGLNCGIGVAHMLRFFKQTELPGDKFISALPNCGYPHVIRGKTIYSDSVPYYGERMEKILNFGVNVIGGCCGTTPAYIKELNGRFANRKPEKKKIRVQKGQGENKEAESESFPLIERMNRGEKVIAVELDPPFHEDHTKLMEGAYYLKEKGVDMITIADSPMARSRADSFLVASKIIRDVAIPVIPHLTCRDRNRISLRSTLLGGYMNDIRNVLVVTGDPVERAEKDITKSVFDFNSIRFMEFISGMNEELFWKDPICMGGALNQNGADLSAIAARMEKKKKAGASFFMTQPIYDEEGIERIRFLKSQVDTKIFCGIMPLVSYRNAMFIHNEMPGIHVPKEVVDRYHPAMSKEEAEETAIHLCVELIHKMDDVADGYYFMTPFNRVSLIGRIIEKSKIKEERK